MAFGLIRGPHDPGAIRLGAALFANQPAPPTQCDYHNVLTLDGDALGNDSIGDCYEAGTFRMAQIRMANAWGSSWKPSLDPVIRLYTNVMGYNPITGANDNGTLPAKIQAYLYTTGLDLGLQSIEVPIPGAVDHTNIDAIKHAIFAYGGCGLQFALPLAWKSLINAGSVWNIPNSGVDSPAGKPAGWADHFVPSGKYDDRYVYIISWGWEYAVSWAAVAAYCIAASCELSRTTWFKAGSGLTPSGLTWEEADNLILAA